MRSILSVLAISLSLVTFGCNSDVTDKVTDAADLAGGVPRKDINVSQTGVNAFFNDARFGSIPEQYAEITKTLNIKHIRVLLAWNDAMQPSPSAQLNFGFTDDILGAIPQDADVLLILTDVPRWMSDSANWINNNPRTTFVKKLVEPTVQRYRNNPRIAGWQIWNEPNMLGRFDNSVLQLDTDPNNYLELIATAHSTCKDNAPGKLVVGAATTAINQNFPDTLTYNRKLRDGGLLQFIDVFAMHYYSRQYENVIRNNGVQDFFESVNKPVWVTESGAQGTDEQLKYVEQTWPFLTDKIGSKIERFYYYQMYSPDSPDVTYGLRNLSQDLSVSDLYVYLRDKE